MIYLQYSNYGVNMYEILWSKILLKKYISFFFQNIEIAVDFPEGTFKGRTDLNKAKKKVE